MKSEIRDLVDVEDELTQIRGIAAFVGFGAFQLMTVGPGEPCLHQVGFERCFKFMEERLAELATGIEEIKTSSGRKK